jgi:quercetin dioxygenase-like cupin family protein
MSDTLIRPAAVRPVTGLAAVARQYAEDAESWPFTPRFAATARWYGRIAAAEDHEAWLLTWLPGQSTDIHDHGGSAGAFHVVSGALTEQSFAAAGSGPVIPRDRLLTAGQVRAFGPHHVHRMVNTSDAPAVSLHVYAPALSEMTRYRLADGVLAVDLVEKAGVDW